MADITVSIPARPEFIHVLRSVIASVAARMNFPYDGIDDLRIAVDEASAHLLSVGQSATSVLLRISTSEAGIEVVASLDADDVGWPPEGAEQTLTWQVLSGLVDEARFERAGGGPAIRFAKKLPS